MENGQVLARRGDQDWQTVDDFTSAYALDGDFMGFLAGTKNIVKIGDETRNQVSFTRYTFELDGPGYAAVLRDQLEAQLVHDGKMPAWMSLDLPAQYRDMTGDGELWVRADGLPLRQIITMHFPPNPKEDFRTDAAITVDFSGFPAQINGLPVGSTAESDGLSGL
jgi:hypothetical protein